MFSTKNTFTAKLDGFYENKSTGNEFPLVLYMSNTSNNPPCMFYVNETMTSGVLDFLLENGTMVYHSVSGKIKKVILDKKSFRGGTFIFKYKDIFVKLIVKNVEDAFFQHSYTNSHGDVISMSDETREEKMKDLESKTYEMMIYYHLGVKDLHLKDFEQFVENFNCSKIHLFVKNRYEEYSFEPIKLDIPENINIELNYGKKFLEVEEQIVKRLTENSKGLYMFHGPPGTGKSTFLKYLTTKVNKDFIYIPAIMVDTFINNPSNLSSLLDKKNSIIILEDAEKAIIKRMNDGMDSSSVTSLLNISDGILGDVLKCPIILTYNCPKQDIDDALKRKGRLQVDYEFGPLGLDDSKKLAKHLGFSKKEIETLIVEEMAIADIYNLTKKTEMTEKKIEKKVIGFGV